MKKKKMSEKTKNPTFKEQRMLKNIVSLEESDQEFDLQMSKEQRMQ